MGAGCSHTANRQETEELKRLSDIIDKCVATCIPNMAQHSMIEINFEGFSSKRKAVEEAMLKRGYRKITPSEYKEALSKPNESIFLWHRVDGLDYREEPNPVNTSDLNLLLNYTTSFSNLRDNSMVSTSDAMASIHPSEISTDKWPTPSKKCSQRAIFYDYPYRLHTLPLLSYAHFVTVNMYTCMILGSMRRLTMVIARGKLVSLLACMILRPPLLWRLTNSIMITIYQMEIIMMTITL